MKPNYGQLAHLGKAIEKAEAQMAYELEKQFPVNSPVRCWIMHGQQNPSHGTVIGHRGGRHAYVTVRLDSRTRHVRDVPASDVRLCHDAGEPR